MKQQTIKNLVQAYQELVQIPVKGADTARMAKALTWIESVHEDLIQEYKQQEENKQDTEEEK